MSYVAFRVPIIGAVPPGSLHKASIYRERERHFIYRVLFYCLSKSLVNEPLLQVPQWGPSGERCTFPEPSFTYPSGYPINDPFLHVPPTLQ